MVVLLPAELLARLGSTSNAETLAILTAVPGVLATVTMVTVAPSAFCRVPRSQVTVCPLVWQVPWLVGERVAETKETESGSVSFKLKAVAGQNPLLVTAMV